MNITHNSLMSSVEKTTTEVSIFFAGWQACPPSHFCRFCMRDYYVLHYVDSGSGEFHTGKTTYNLSAGDGFLAVPSSDSSHKSSSDNPWVYYWVGFYGPGAKMLLETADLSADNPVFHYDKDDYIKKCLKNIIRATSACESVEYEALGHFYLLMSRLIEQRALTNREKVRESDDYVKKAIRYIHCNYWRDITVNEVAQYVGLDRSQLFRLFKNSTDYSPQQYLINYRFAKACELITKTDLKFDEIAHSVGFEYPSYFFRLFKKQAGVTPSEYRQYALAAKST